MRMVSGFEEGPPRVFGVAYACGYESLKGVSKAFHTLYGVNPRDVGVGRRVDAHRESGETLMFWMKNS